MGGKVVCPMLSYQINGALFEVHDAISGGHPEKYY